jgi:hypothetical protein
MSVTLNPPARVLTLVGVLALTGIAAFLFLLGRGTSTEPSAPISTLSTPHVTPPARATKPAQRHRTAAAPSAHVRVDTDLPDGVADALRSNRVAIVTVSIPGAAVDAYVRGEARAAARMSSAGYVGITTTRTEALARLIAKTGVLPDPAVVIMKRPGTVVATLSVADRETIAQVVGQARAAR